MVFLTGINQTQMCFFSVCHHDALQANIFLYLIWVSVSLCGGYCDATIEMAQLPTLLKYASMHVWTLCPRSSLVMWLVLCDVRLVAFLFLNMASLFVQGASVDWDWFTPTSRARCRPSPSRTCPSTFTWLSSGRASLCSSSASSSAVTSSGEKEQTQQ